ncbi:hypothetical protein Tco_0115246, partial [Tanacetum coccineum]
LRPKLPDQNSTIKDSLEEKIGMYTRFIEFANYWIPLSKFLLCVLEYYQINLSQLSVIGATKIDTFVCPLSTPWFNGTSVVKDTLPVDKAVDLPYVELLNENRTLTRKYPKTFLCLVGLSRSFIETDVCPTLLYDNDEEIGLLDFVKSADPFKVKVGEQTLADNKDELNINSGKRKKIVAFVSGSSPMKKARAEADTSSGSAAPVTEDVTSSSVTPTLERVLEDAFHDNVRTRPPSGRFVVLSSGSADTYIPASLQVVSPVTSAPIGVNAPVAESVGDVRRSSGSGPEAGHEIMTREKFEKKFTDSVVIVHQRDVKIADLNARLEKSEAEATEVIELRNRVSDLEATVSIKVGELTNFHTQNVGLVERVSALELERDGLKNQVVGKGKMREEFVSQQDTTKQCFAERATKLDARIADVRRDMDNDLYPHMLTAIAGRRWVVGHGFRLAVYKCAHSVECRSSLGKVILMAINKGIQQVLEAGIGVSFPLLDELESLKDSPLALIMSTLTLKDDQGNKDAAPEFALFQSSIDQFVVPVYSKSSFIDREMLLSGAIPTTCITDYQVSTLFMAGDGGSANQPPVTQPHDDLFDTSILDKPGDV